MCSCQETPSQRKTHQIFGLPSSLEQQATPSTSRCSSATPDVPWLLSCPGDGEIASVSTPRYQNGGWCGHPSNCLSCPSDGDITSVSTPWYQHEGCYGHPPDYLEMASACASDSACTPHSPQMTLAPCINIESVCKKLQHFIDECFQKENGKDLS